MASIVAATASPACRLLMPAAFATACTKSAFVTLDAPPLFQSGTETTFGALPDINITLITVGQGRWLRVPLSEVRLQLIRSGTPSKSVIFLNI